MEDVDLASGEYDPVSVLVVIEALAADPDTSPRQVMYDHPDVTPRDIVAAGKLLLVLGELNAFTGRALLRGYELAEPLGFSGPGITWNEVVEGIPEGWSDRDHLDRIARWHDLFAAPLAQYSVEEA